MLITLGLSGLHIHSSPIVLLAADVPEPLFPSPPFPGSKVQRRKKRQVWFHRGVFKLTESDVYGCLFLHSQCHIIFMWNFQKDRSGLGFQIHIDFPLSHFTFLWQDRTRVWIELCLTSQLFLFSGSAYATKCRGWNQIRRVNGDQWSFNGKLFPSCSPR